MWADSKPNLSAGKFLLAHIHIFVAVIGQMDTLGAVPPCDASEKNLSVVRLGRPIWEQSEARVRVADLSE